MPKWDHSVDLLVIGSGAGAMSAGIRGSDLGLDVLLVEKGETYGGSSAMSGGVCWVGNNLHMAKSGITDSDEDTLTYLSHITQGEVPDSLLVNYRDNSKRMVEYFAQKTHLHFMPLTEYTDYYPEAPGGKLGGRSMEPLPFDGSLLENDFNLLHPPAQSALIMGKMMITAKIAKTMIMLGFKSLCLMAWLFIKYAFRYPTRRKYGRDPYLTNGNALMGRLRLSLKDRNVPIWLKSPASELIFENGRAVGAVIEKDGQSMRVEAKRGVLLAAGGFERNLKMREEYGPKPASVEWTAGNEHNTGDAIQMGMKAGAGTALMSEAWWTPVTQYPGSKDGWVLVVEKSLPGGIFINGLGKRFTNESAPYVDVVVEMYKDHQKTGKTVPGWMVFDADYRHNYIAGPVGPGKALPDKTLPRKLRKDFLLKAGSLDELAQKLGVDAPSLSETVKRFNEMAHEGKDLDFGRGESAADRYYGDDRVSPNPCMAPLNKAPYYAIPLFPGDLGTKGGLTTDADARVLKENGQPIEGLYAAGNTSASVMGRTYPGAGGTIGPALCYGFLAAEAAAKSEAVLVGVQESAAQAATG
ncbi:MAG: FAD-binding protein [Deltaproteobacteria bacterium]|jgi:3-oxosteroid 1-dehydrogenase|nr:FAD-binding protein [Deltaproteobacteria bacterium]MBT6434552.1 FAD-binding protein [Deltaproteobacteria bacterium]MBT6488563.1 FAD-binding protein [Deltaproteobacteria bacterium]